MLFKFSSHFLLLLTIKVFLCSTCLKYFNKENTVAFYELPNIIKLTGTTCDNLKELLKESKSL